MARSSQYDHKIEKIMSNIKLCQTTDDNCAALIQCVIGGHHLYIFYYYSSIR